MVVFVVVLCFFFLVTHNCFISTQFVFLLLNVPLPNLAHMHVFLQRHSQSLFYQCCILKGSVLFFFVFCSLRHLVSSEISPTSLASNITLHREAAMPLSLVNLCYLFVLPSIHPCIQPMHRAWAGTTTVKRRSPAVLQLAEHWVGGSGASTTLQ